MWVAVSACEGRSSGFHTSMRRQPVLPSPPMRHFRRSSLRRSGSQLDRRRWPRLELVCRQIWHLGRSGPPRCGLPAVPTTRTRCIRTANRPPGLWQVPLIASPWCGPTASRSRAESGRPQCFGSHGPGRRSKLVVAGDPERRHDGSAGESSVSRGLPRGDSGLAVAWLDERGATCPSPAVRTATRNTPSNRTRTFTWSVRPTSAGAGAPTGWAGRPPAPAADLPGTWQGRASVAAWRRHFPGNVRDVVPATISDTGRRAPAGAPLYWAYAGCPHSGPALAAAADGATQWSGTMGSWDPRAYATRRRVAGQSTGARGFARGRAGDGSGPPSRCRAAGGASAGTMSHRMGSGASSWPGWVRTVGLKAARQ